MNNIINNLLLLTGLGMIGAGVGMLSVPAALVTVGSLVIVLTLTVALTRKG